MSLHLGPLDPFKEFASASGVIALDISVPRSFPLFFHGFSPTFEDVCFIVVNLQLAFQFDPETGSFGDISSTVPDKAVESLYPGLPQPESGHGPVGSDR